MPSTSLLLHSPNFEAAPGRALARGLGAKQPGAGALQAGPAVLCLPQASGLSGGYF